MVERYHFPGVKQQELEADHLLPSNAELNNEVKSALPNLP
jgi:hypothetical protein